MSYCTTQYDTYCAVWSTSYRTTQNDTIRGETRAVDLSTASLALSELSHIPHIHIRLTVVWQQEWLMHEWIFQLVVFNWMDSEAPVRGQRGRYVYPMQRSPGTGRIAVSKSARVLFVGWQEWGRHRLACNLCRGWLHSSALSLMDVSNHIVYNRALLMGRRIDNLATSCRTSESVVRGGAQL